MSEPTVTDLAGAILDGTPVDWPTAESTANEIERSLSQPATRKDARLRDVFKAYKAAA